MLWFTGSSREGLPFIHDSFPANPKAVHHKPRHPRPPQHQENHSSGSTTTRTANAKDVSKEILDSEAFKLPAVDPVGPINGHVRSRSLGRGENGRDPTSFTSYMHRYKACARLKGISLSRAYCSTRMKAVTSDSDLDPSASRFSSKDALTTTIPLSNLRVDLKADPPPGSTEAEAPRAELPDLAPQDSDTAVNSPTDCSLLEKQIEEKLKRGGSQDDGMMTSHLHGDRHSRGRRRRKGGRGGGSDGISSRGRVSGGGRPLGDIVSPRRLQELLSQREDRTLPYTYYRTAVTTEDPDLDQPDLASLL